MYTIHGINISSNTTKTVYVAEAAKLDYEFVPVDLASAGHKSPEHMKRHPFGKIPTLTHNNRSLFESNAICAYLASVENSGLYPLDDMWQKALVDQWTLFFTNHLGRHLNTYAFEKAAKVKYGFGTPDEILQAEALEFMLQQLPVVNDHIEKNTWFLENTISIADYVAFAYFETTEMAEFSLGDYPAIETWYNNIKGSDAVKAACKKIGRE